MAAPNRAYTAQPYSSAPCIDPLALRAQQVNPEQKLFLNDFVECIICANETPDSIGIFPCGHGVCGECAPKLIKGPTDTKFPCPLCKKPVVYDTIVTYPLSKSLCDNHKEVVTKINGIKRLTADRMADVCISPNQGPVAHFGIASAPGEIATIIAVPPVDSLRPAKKAIVYVLDKSGSFEEALRGAIAALRLALEANIGGYAAFVVFSDKAETLVPPHRITQENIPATMAALDTVKADGMTMLHDALNLVEDEVAPAMNKLIDEDGEYAVVLAHIVTDGAASCPELAAQVLGSMCTPPFVFGFGTGYDWMKCDQLFSRSPHSATNFVHAKNTDQLKHELLREQRALSRVQVACPAGSRVYCNGRVTTVNATGAFGTSFDPKNGIRLAVGAPAALDLGTLTIGGCVAIATQDAKLGFEVGNFMLAMLVLEYVMGLGSKIHVDDSCTLFILLSRLRTAVHNLGPSMTEVILIIDEQLAQVAATTSGRHTDSNTIAQVASSVIGRCCSHA